MMFSKIFVRTVAAMACLLSFSNANDEAIVYNLGNRRPEGMYIPKGEDVPEHLQNVILVGELYFGGINAVHVNTGEINPIVPAVGFGQRLIAGIWYDGTHDMIIAAGAAGEADVGPPPTIHVFNGTSGDVLSECTLTEQATFANDVAVIDGTAYITDSFTNSLHVLALTSVGDCNLRTITLPADLFVSTEGNFRGNGIRPYKDGLLIANSILGALYWFDPQTEELSEFIPEGQAPSADGLCFSPDGTILYVVENMKDRVSAWRVPEEEEDDDDESYPTFLGYIESAGNYETGTTCDTMNDTIWVVNARFNTIGLISDGEGDPNFPEEFTLVGVPANPALPVDEEENKSEDPNDEIATDVDDAGDADVSGVIIGKTHAIGTALATIAAIITIA